MMDVAALLLLGMCIGWAASQRAAGFAGFSIVTSAALLLLWMLNGKPSGFGLMLLLGYGLALMLSALARGGTGAPALLAGLTAGLLAVTGPFGIIAATTAIASYGLLGARRKAGRSAAIAAILLFVPLTVLAAYAAAALIETGVLSSIAAGQGPFLRGRAPDIKALILAAPGLLPLALMLSPNLRGQAAATLAPCLGGLAASLALASAAPILPFALASGLAAAQRRTLLLPAALALASLAALSPAAQVAAEPPLIALWRIDAHRPETLPAWGASDAFSAEHPGVLPQISRIDGQYQLAQGSSGD